MFLPWDVAECKSHKLAPRRMRCISGGCVHSLLLNMVIQMQNLSHYTSVCWEPKDIKGRVTLYKSPVLTLSNEHCWSRGCWTRQTFGLTQNGSSYVLSGLIQYRQN